MANKADPEYDTWNVKLWLENTEWHQKSMTNFMKNYKGKNPYRAYIYHVDFVGQKTGDGVSWLAKKMDYKDLNEYMNEYAERSAG